MTASADRPWLRLYSETTRDLKLRREKPETRWLWITLLCMAGRSPERGSLFVGSSPARLADIADEAALPMKKVRDGMGALEAAGMIEKNGDGAWHLRKWAERQFESDRSTERVRAFRERRRNVSGNESETPQESETDTELGHLPPPSEPLDQQPVDDDERIVEEQPLDPVEVKIRAVLDRCVESKMRTQTPSNPSAYRAKILTNLYDECGAKLHRAITETHPTAPIEVLAGWLLDEPNSLANYRAAAS